MNNKKIIIAIIVIVIIVLVSLNLYFKELENKKSRETLDTALNGINKIMEQVKQEEEENNEVPINPEVINSFGEVEYLSLNKAKIASLWGNNFIVGKEKEIGYIKVNNVTYKLSLRILSMENQNTTEKYYKIAIILNDGEQEKNIETTSLDEISIFKDKYIIMTSLNLFDKEMSDINVYSEKLEIVYNKKMICRETFEYEFVEDKLTINSYSDYDMKESQKTGLNYFYRVKYEVTENGGKFNEKSIDIDHDDIHNFIINNNI